MYAAIVVGPKVAEGPGRLREGIMSRGREQQQSDPGADRQRWFAAKLVAALAVTIVAAYVTAMLL